LIVSSFSRGIWARLVSGSLSPLPLRGNGNVVAVSVRQELLDVEGLLLAPHLIDGPADLGFQDGQPSSS
jgi:hypothetical protein